MPTNTPRKRSCLIVEDEPLIGMDLEDALVTAGYAVEWVASMQAARDTIAARSFDVAIVDLLLHDDAATELASDLRRRGIPFVVHSGSPPRHGPPELLEAVWLMKPVKAEEILKALDDVQEAERPV